MRAPYSPTSTQKYLAAEPLTKGTAAEAAAVREFNLTDEQRSRLVVQERG
jgi:hypothetical protein